MPQVQPPRSSSSTDTGLMFNCFCKWSELKPPNSIPLGNQACFHHTGPKRVRETVTSTMQGTTQYNATLMPLRGFKMTSARFDMLQENCFNRTFVFKSINFFSTHKQESDKEIKLYRRKNKTKQNLHRNVSVLCFRVSEKSDIMGDGKVRCLFSSSVAINIYKREIKSSLEALTLRGNNATRRERSFESFYSSPSNLHSASFVPSSTWRRLSLSLFPLAFFRSPPSFLPVQSTHTESLWMHHRPLQHWTQHKCDVVWGYMELLIWWWIGYVGKKRRPLQGREAGQWWESTTTETVAGEAKCTEEEWSSGGKVRATRRTPAAQHTCRQDDRDTPGSSSSPFDSVKAPQSRKCFVFHVFYPFQSAVLFNLKFKFITL